jgi:DNA-binding transcriptional LysR family regulator
MTQPEPLRSQITPSQQKAQTTDHFEMKPGFEKFRRLHDVKNLYVNLKQWRTLQAVVDCNGFSEAAEFLHQSQSAVSYTVAKLQEHLALPLLAPGRKVQPTEAGRVLLDRSRRLLKEAIELEQYAEQLRHGGEMEINFVVDAIFPSDLLTKALARFAQINGCATVRLREATTGGAERLLLNKSPDVVIVASSRLAFLGKPLVNLAYISVAHASHPLVQLQRPINCEDLVRHIRVSADSLEQSNVSANGPTIWSMRTMQRAIDVVKAGLGYGWFPRYFIAKLLDEKTLVELPLADGQAYVQTIYLIQARRHPTQAATSDLIDVLQEVCAQPDVVEELLPKLRKC